MYGFFDEYLLNEVLCFLIIPPKMCIRGLHDTKNTNKNNNVNFRIL